MKTSNQFTIIYDDTCPMCNIYTNVFVRNKWIANRCSFSTVNSDMLNSIDTHRCKNEIPLYNAETHQTVYGIDSLMTVLGSQFKILQPIFRNTVFRYLMQRLYYLVSFNRRVIAGSKPNAQGFDCAPSFDIKYRLIYIFILLFSSMALFHTNHLFITGLVLTIIVGVVSIFHKHSIETLGHLITILFLSSIVSLFHRYIEMPFLSQTLIIGFFTFFSIKRLIIIDEIFKSEEKQSLKFRIAEIFLQLAKYLLVFKAKIYSKENLPAWLEVPMASTDKVGKNFYQTMDTNSYYGETNSKGLCDLNEFNSKEFNANYVHPFIVDFYKNTHRYDFETKQKWIGLTGNIIKWFNTNYNSVVQQFNFSDLDVHHAKISNYLTPMNDGKNTMINWVRHNDIDNKTMFSGFYHPDTLPDTEKKCVTTKFPMKDMCFMVKLKPCNENKGGFAFVSEEDKLGGYSFYMVFKLFHWTAVVTLPIREKIHLEVKNYEVNVNHEFYWKSNKFMQLNYIAKEYEILI